MRFSNLGDWLKWQESLHPKAIDLGLARVRSVFQALDLDSLMPFTLTVGGTNGKGSSVAMLDAILRAQGYRVGTYTSPHLLRYNERMRINGECVDDEVLCETFDRIDHARGEISLSFFEFGTLAALDIFSKTELDVQILEVGLGGRLDAVNLVETDGALIASIDLDHQDWLGVTRDAISVEKAGIFRSGRPCVVGDPQPPPALLAHARENHLDLLCQGEAFRYDKSDHDWTWIGRKERVEQLPFPALEGEHQLRNAAGVIQLLKAVHAHRPVADAAIREGIASVQLDGRFQYFAGSVPVLVDVAHNPQAVAVLAEHLREHHADKRVHAVFSIMRDKDIRSVVQHMRAEVYRWYLAPLSMTRAATLEELEHLLSELGIQGVESGFVTALDAFAAARGNAQNGDLVVVFGSFFLVSEYLAETACL